MAKSTPEVADAAGRPVKLGRIIGQGGEGAVYEVESDAALVAKVYHKPLSGDRADKIRAMGSLGNDVLARLTAWPAGLLTERAAGRPIGLLMPKVLNRKDIHQLYSPKSRRSEFLRADWRFLVRAATNTARAFAAVHEAGCVIGDVNHGGILVAQDATVTLIDCDSFQVSHAGRRFLCEVGVETFTPPELQGRSFQGVVRTPAHDDFGLAVMTFLLLFMGRHPFAGRFSGQGDMPISRAIEEHRFAYGQRRAALHMTQPPGTPPLSIVGPQTAALFERAFMPNAVTLGRPTARDWLGALAALERELKQCSVNPSHWHHTASSCPWCPMEGATGVALFPSVVQGASGTLFDMARLWQEVEAVPHPGRAPTIDVPAPKPSPEAVRLSGWETKRQSVAGVSAAGMALLTFVFGPIMLLAAFVTYLTILASMNKTDEITPFKDALKAADKKWELAQSEWLKRAGPEGYERQKADLVSLRNDWNQIPAVRTRMLGELERDRERVQRLRYLDQFEIENAKIEGIGKGRKLTLASYGVETAADITPGAVSQVPGFGPKMQSRLLVWRSSLEQKFVFDPRRQVDPRDIAKVEQEVVLKKRQIEDKIKLGLAQLRQSHSQILLARQHMISQVEAVRLVYLQAQANKDAVQ